MGCRLCRLVCDSVCQSHGAWHHGKDVPSVPARLHCTGIMVTIWYKKLQPIIYCTLCADLVAYVYLSGSEIDAALGLELHIYIKA